MCTHMTGPYSLQLAFSGGLFLHMLCTFASVHIYIYVLLESFRQEMGLGFSGSKEPEEEKGKKERERERETGPCGGKGAL